MAIRGVVDASKPADVIILLGDFNLLLAAWCVNDGNRCIEQVSSSE